MTLCASLHLPGPPVTIFVLLFGIAQPIWCSETKLGQGCKEAGGAQAPSSRLL